MCLSSSVSLAQEAKKGPMGNKFSGLYKKPPHPFCFGFLKMEDSWSLYDQIRAWILTSYWLGDKKPKDRTHVTYAANGTI